QLGLGLDEQAALVVQGRRLRVLGDSYVSLCLAAGGRRAVSVQVLHDKQEADLIALRRAAYGRTQTAFPPDKAPEPVVAKGTLVIGGGGGMTLDIWKRFIQLAGGPEACIVVVPTALDDPVPAEPGEVKALRRAGATNIKILHTRKRSD